MAFTKRVVALKKDFDMSSASACVFHHSQWETCIDGEHASLPYFIYRIVFMILLISSLLFSTLCQSYLFQIFLTNWSFTLQTLYSILFSFNIVWAKRDFLHLKLRRILGKSTLHNSNSNPAKSYELKEAVSWCHSIDTVTTNATTGNNANSVNINIDGGNSDDHNYDHDALTMAISTSTKTADDRDNDEEKFQQSQNNGNNNVNGIIGQRKRSMSPLGGGGPSLLEKVIWVLMNVSHVLPHIVALGYWIFVYKYDPDQPKCEAFRSHFIVHGACSVLALIDSLIVAVPVRKSHFIFPSFVLLVYTIFSYIYELAGGPYRNGKEFIYSVLNWRHKPGRTALIVTVGMIFSPAIHLILCWGLHHIRLKLVQWTNKSKQSKK